jgi:ELMO/CED-12 family
MMNPTATSSTDEKKPEPATIDTNSAAASSTSSSASTTPQEQLRKTALFAKGFADDAGRALGSFLPTASLQSITTRKYTLPDKTVASQVLMYRQLLHTKCRPGLKLSRPYQGTPAQKAVMHMPWWEKGIQESQKMVISYDNLISRLWLNGAIEPFQYQGTITGDSVGEMNLLGDTEASASEKPVLETFMTDEGLPPIPHEYWVDRLGFQQPDPVTDFRSGGVLSLAMMVYMVESKPVICQRFFTGDTAVLPFGITCINVTDMIAKFLMLAKSTDRMDALLSQKPFWKMFADPNAILAVQELAMSMLCDVAVELGQEKKVPSLAKLYSDGMPGDASDRVCNLPRKYLDHFCFSHASSLNHRSCR